MLNSQYPAFQLKALKKEAETLIAEKEKRTRSQAELYEALQQVCRRLDIEDDHLYQNVDEKIYSKDELSAMRRTLSKLYDTVAKRQEEVIELQRESKK